MNKLSNIFLSKGQPASGWKKLTPIPIRSGQVKSESRIFKKLTKTSFGSNLYLFLAFLNAQLKQVREEFKAKLSGGYKKI